MAVDVMPLAAVMVRLFLAAIAPSEAFFWVGFKDWLVTRFK